MKTYKTSDFNKNGFTGIVYKDGRKAAAYIYDPSKYNGNKYTTYIPVTRCGGVGGHFDTFADADNAIKKFLAGINFGGENVEIVWHWGYYERITA